MSDDIRQLQKAAYEFIYSRVLQGTGWEDAVVAVEARQASHSSGHSVSCDLLPTLTCAVTGGSIEGAIPLAAAWILCDLASDIFDDIQDRDGKDRPWSRWHPSQAMCVGLGLIAGANACLANLQTSQDALCDILGSWGRTLMLAARDQWNAPKAPTLEQYFTQTVTKSGLIYASVAYAGARLSTDESLVLEAMREYGMGLGMITQIWDDCLDLSPDRIQSDLVIGMYTLPVIFALSLDEDPNYPRLLALLDKSNELTLADTEEIESILEAMGALSFCMTMMKVYEQKALNALGIIGDGPCAANLENYVSAFFLSEDA